MHGRHTFATTGQDIVELKFMDETYGSTLIKNLKARRTCIEARDRQQGTPPKKSRKTLSCDIPQTHPKGYPVQRLGSAHSYYASLVDNRFDHFGSILYDRKRKRIQEVQKEAMAARWLSETIGLDGHPLFAEQNHADQRREKKESLRQRRMTNIERAKKSMNTMSVAEQGEKNLLKFIQRFHGGFFYQKKQLFFEGFQLLFVNAVIATLAANIVGPSWSVVGPRICKQFGWTEKDFKEVLVAQAPRRFGKSIAIAVSVINYALSKSPCEIAIFSTCKRVSGFLQEKIKDILIQSGYGDWIVNIGGEYIYLKDPNDPDDQIRKIFSYPASTVISISSFL